MPIHLSGELLYEAAISRNPGIKFRKNFDSKIWRKSFAYKVSGRRKHVVSIHTCCWVLCTHMPESSNLYKSYVFSKLVVFKINVSKNKNFLKHLRKHNNMLLKIHLGSLCFHDLCDKERNKWEPKYLSSKGISSERVVFESCIYSAKSIDQEKNISKWKAF